MVSKSWRRYDVQATYAMRCALASLLPAAGGVALALRNYRHELGQIVYGSKGFFVPLFAGCVMLSLAIAASGFALGWNSSGQRRNENQKQSWIGFFLGGTVVTLDIILLIAFWMLRLQQPL